MRYFDKTFFRFFFGFTAIIVLSCIVIIGARMYELSQEEKQNEAAAAILNAGLKN